MLWHSRLRERLEKSRASGDPRLKIMFDRLDNDLNDALSAIAASSEKLEEARKLDISEIPVRFTQTCPRQFVCRRLHVSLCCCPCTCTLAGY